MSTIKIDNCKTCNNEFTHRTYDSQQFCSKNCANNFRKVGVNCEVCKVEILKPASNVKRNTKNYCSRNCYNFRNGIPKTLKRGTAHFQNLLRNSSCECGESRYYLLQIHHKDGNDNFNEAINLEILCSNCHIKRHLKLNKKGEYVYHPASLTDRSLLEYL